MAARPGLPRRAVLAGLIACGWRPAGAEARRFRIALANLDETPGVTLEGLGFTGAELRDRLSLGDKREDIMAGLHRAIILRAMSILARSGGIRNEFTFTGGVAKNQAAVKALKDLVRENYGELTLNINPDSIYTGALGGATFAWRAVVEEGKAAEARA